MPKTDRSRLFFALAGSLVLACAAGCEGPESANEAPADGAGELACEPDGGGISLPEGFCAVLFADALGPARHLDVAPAGEVFVALRNTRNPDRSTSPGGIVALRDTDGDGRSDVLERWGENGGNDVLLHGDFLYFAPNDAVLRYPLEPGALAPSGPPDTIVAGLPDTQSHTAKSIAIRGDALFVNVGSPSNACQEQDRVQLSPGRDPCPELETRAGIWRFAAGRVGQTQADGVQFATGLRNTVALRVDLESGRLYGAVHGRDQLATNWPELFTNEESAEKPAEELVQIEEGDDFGWPYCYYDRESGTKVLAPEYGGDGSRVGRCDGKKDPVLAFPGHWAPNDLEFYTGQHFPARYQGGAFLAFHGSWNRAPLPQGGYNVVFVPFAGGEPTGEWEVFAEGFAGEDVTPQGADHRPVGLAMGPDGSLYVSDSRQGRIWRIVYKGVGGA